MNGQKRNPDVVRKQLTREQNKARIQKQSIAETTNELERITSENADGKYNALAASLRTKLIRQTSNHEITEEYVEFLKKELAGLEPDPAQLTIAVAANAGRTASALQADRDKRLTDKK